MLHIEQMRVPLGEKSVAFFLVSFCCFLHSVQYVVFLSWTVCFSCSTLQI